MKVVMILEILGRPPQHLTETLEKIISEIEKEKGASVKSKKINEPVLAKDKKDFYTSFAEVEIDVEDIIYLAILMFKYMPSHIEIISPELIALTNSDLNDIFNELIRRLHAYDEVVAVLKLEKKILEDKLRFVLKKHPELLEDQSKAKEKRQNASKKK